MDAAVADTPESFERIIMSDPNNSYTWIQYMAFKIKMVEIDAAREIARRALKKIFHEKEEERLNVWIALLNLEARFGSDEQLQSVC